MNYYIFINQRYTPSYLILCDLEVFILLKFITKLAFRIILTTNVK